MAVPLKTLVEKDSEIEAWLPAYEFLNAHTDAWTMIYFAETFERNQLMSVPLKTRVEQDSGVEEWSPAY